MKVFVGHVKNEICDYIVSTDSLCKQQHNGPYLLYYLCKTYSEQYTESTYAFWPEFNDYKCVRRIFFLKQELFIAHFAEASASHNVGNDLKVRLINQTDNIEERRKTEHFWQDELDTFQSNELNGRKVALLFCGFSTETFKNGFHQKIPWRFYGKSLPVKFPSELLFVLGPIVLRFLSKRFQLAKCHEIPFVSCRAEEGSTTHELFLHFHTVPVSEKETCKNLLAIISEGLVEYVSMILTDFIETLMLSFIQLYCARIDTCTMSTTLNQNVTGAQIIGLGKIQIFGLQYFFR